MRALYCLFAVIFLAGMAIGALAEPPDGAPLPWKPEPYDVQADEDYRLRLEHRRAEMLLRKLQAVCKLHNDDPRVVEKWTAARQYHDEYFLPEIEKATKRIAEYRGAQL